MEMKWMAIMFIGVMGTGMIAMGIEDYTEGQTAIEASRAGLEECPNLNGHRGNTIWVKDCKVFIDSYYENKEK